MKTYRTGFLLAVIANIVLASVLAGVWWHSQTSRPTTSSALAGTGISGRAAALVIELWVESRVLEVGIPFTLNRVKCGWAHASVTISS